MVNKRALKKVRKILSKKTGQRVSLRKALEFARNDVRLKFIVENNLDSASSAE